MPQKGDERWIDIALFYLGAIITVQAFADGNKRVARTAFAIVMVNGGVEFVAPNVKFENDLAQMAAK
jgi:prophage maintenance system killer protein